ncbi:hypothetical protein D3C78_1057340 [compost metagenome]
MRGALALDGLAQRLRQGFVGALLAGEQGVAALLRQLLGIEHRAEAGQLLVGQVRVPELAGIAQADRLPVLDDVGDDEEFRMPWQQELLEHVDLQLAEQAAEGNLLLRSDVLVAEHQQAMVQMREVDVGEILRIERAGQIQPDDFRAQGVA